MKLITSRLRIDAYRPADLPDLYRIATLPQVARMLIRFYPDMPMAEAERILATDAETLPIRLVVRHRQQVVGSIGMSDAQPGEIFYFLDPSVAGQGLAQEMTRAFLTGVQGRFHPDKLVANVFADNIASQKVLEKIGFQASHRHEAKSLGRSSPAPCLQYEWLRGDQVSAADPCGFHGPGSKRA